MLKIAALIFLLVVVGVLVWEKKDPNLRRSYGGAAEGKGATYAWEGDRNVGQGRMEIPSRPGSRT